MNIAEREKDLITVCDKCLRASCWKGIFMCDESSFAGIVEMEKTVLIEMELEHKCYLTND